MKKDELQIIKEAIVKGIDIRFYSQTEKVSGEWKKIHYYSINGNLPNGYPNGFKDADDCIMELIINLEENNKLK